MCQYTSEELLVIIEKHGLWYQGKKGGERAVLSGDDLTWAQLDGAFLRNACLSGANLTRANLFQADLKGANLSKANLNGANLFQADLRNANLQGASLRNATLVGASFAGVQGKQIVSYVYNKHTAVYVDGCVDIGCQNNSVAHWLENYEVIGKKHSYTDEEISHYGNFIKYVSTLGD